MHESMRPAEPDPDQLRASLIAEHGDKQIMLNGQAIAFRDYVAVGDMLCPIPAEQRSPEDNLRRLTKELVQMDVQLDEKYAAFVPELPKQDHNQTKPEPKKENVEKRTEKTSEKVERVTVIPTIPEKLKTETLSPVIVTEEKLSEPKKIVSLPKAAIEQTVRLELPVVTAMHPAEIVVKMQEAAPKVSGERIDTAEVETPTPQVIEKIETMVPTEIFISPLEASSETTSTQTETPHVETVQAIETDLELPVFAELFADSDDKTMAEVPYVVINTENSEEQHIILSEVTITEEASPVAISEQSEIAEDSYEEEIAAPLTVVAEFIAQVLPTEMEAVAEKLPTMAHEAATELASRIEMIAVVADRLHDLVVAEATEGEEAKQIISFLKREYEQVLLAVGIEPTDEILEKFIASIFSETYTLQVSSAANYIEVGDEGTHEKKLFDEQSVFAKAQHASSILSQKLGNSIGHILLNKLAS